jgi:trans-2-enoyl-CoA reductase
MKRVDIAAYGAPEQVASCVEVEDVGAPGPGEVVFDVLAFPINPAELSMIRGNYRLHPALPATPGAECVGRVSAVGVGVSDVRPGELVINMARENWAQRRRIRATDALPIPEGIDLKQAAMLRTNPATALLLLEDHVALKPGDWVIQDVANSAVGRHLIVLAKARGIRTINVVRRDDVTDELHALGADVVLADGPDLAEHARDATGGAPIRLGIDAISGEACRQIADCLGDGAVMVNYGGLSGKDPEISRAALNGQAVTLTAFMLGRGLAKRTTAQVRALYAELAAELREGALNAPVDATYSIEDIKSALAHAQRRGRHGKVLVLPNGAI